MTGTRVGYARVSTSAQDLTAQREGLAALGVAPKLVYVDHGLTGRNRDRPGLTQALMAVREGQQPHHNVLRVEDALERLYQSKRYSPAFVTAMRARMTDAVNDQEHAQRLLQAQLKKQLRELDVKEENLLDLLADPDIPRAKVERAPGGRRSRASTTERTARGR